MSETRRTAVGLMVFCTMGIAGSSVAQAEPLFSEDFEIPLGDIVTGAGNAQYDALTARGWDHITAHCNGYCTASIVPAPFGRAGKVLRYEYRSDQDNESVPEQDAHNANLIKVFNPPLSEVWGRVYFATDVNNAENQTAETSLWFCCGTKLHYIKPAAPAPSYLLMSAHPAMPSGAYPHIGVQAMAVCPNGGTPGYLGGGGCNNTVQNASQVRVVDKQWYCIEYHIRINSAIDVADGVIEAWIDNTPIVNYQNQLMVDGHYTLQNARISQIEVYRQHANHMTRYEDDIVWSTTRVGCDAAPDAPSAPTNLRVL